MKRAHVIADLSFREDWCACTCGIVVTPATYWAHRQSLGLERANPAHTFAAPEFPGVFAKKDPRPERDPETCVRGHSGRYAIGYDHKRRCRQCDADRQRKARAKAAA